jgi:sec-independent protein translocase protein TatC
MPKLPDTVAGAKVLGSKMADLHKEANPDGRMPLMEHIRELRSRVIKAALALVIGTGVGALPWVFNPVWHFMEEPYCKAAIHGIQDCKPGQLGGNLVINGIFDPFTLRLEVAFFFGLLVTSPIWIFQIWAFIAPGLYSREKRWTYGFVAVAVPLFLIGAVLAYLVMDRGLHFLLGLSPKGTLILPEVSTYLGYFMAMILGFGLTFELPLTLVVLNYARVLTHARFRKWRRGMIFAVFVFAGIATPSPDPLTMMLLAGPCVVLVEVAEVIVWTHDRALARRPSMYANLSDNEPAPLDDYDDSDDTVDSDS